MYVNIIHIHIAATFQSIIGIRRVPKVNANDFAFEAKCIQNLYYYYYLLSYMLLFTQK